MAHEHATPQPEPRGQLLTAYSAAEVEAELVAYLHHEKTDIPHSVIEHFIAHDPGIAATYRELEELADLLGHLPAATPSRDFVRRVMKSLPKLLAEGRATRRIEELLLRTKWTAEDRFVFFMEYWKHRFHHHPASSAALAASILIMIGVLAWLPSTVVQPERYQPAAVDTPNTLPPKTPAHTALTDLDSMPVIDTRLGPAPKPPTMVGNWYETRDLPDFAHYSATPTPGTNGGSDPPLPGQGNDPLDPANQFTDRIVKQPTPPPGFVVPPEDKVMGWFSRREQADDVRGITGPERRMIDAALAWLATHQNADGSWGDLPQTNQLVNPDREAPGTPSGHAGPALATPKQILITARVLLAFLAENYSTRPSYRPELQPRRSKFSSISPATFATQTEKYREVVKKGFAFLQANADPHTGRIGAAGKGSTIAHAEAMVALTEDWLIGKNWRFRRTLDRAFDYLMRVRNGADGGWGAEPESPSQLTPTCVVVQTLLVYAKTPAARIDMNSPVFRHAGRFMDSCTAPADGLADETPSWDTSGANIARSTMVAVSLGHALYNADHAPAQEFWQNALAQISRDNYRPQWHVDPATNASTVDFDYWMVTAQALSGWPTGVDNATRRMIGDWREQMVNVLRTNQISAGDDAGSWPAVGLAAVNGKAHATATATLALQNRYRYAWLRR